MCFSLKLVENNLSNIVKEQGSNAMEFAELVKENEQILDAMKVRVVYTIAAATSNFYK
jgi:hypothetical protein